MTEKEKAIKIRISGKVQGVGFRSFVKQHALSKEVKGYVKNLPGGEVEAFLQGSEENVNSLIEVVKKGPSASKVEKIQIKETSPIEGDKFEIRI